VIPVDVTVNGRRYREDVEPRLLLSDFLRGQLGLTGTHVGCEHGVCGACTVLLDDVPVRSCLTFAVQANGARILVCGACDMEWRADRVRCPFCGNASQDLLGYLAGGGAGLVIRVCDACRTYLKTIDRRVVGGDESPLLLRMLLAEMDLAAAGAGYGPAPGSLR